MPAWEMEGKDVPAMLAKADQARAAMREAVKTADVIFLVTAKNIPSDDGETMLLRPDYTGMMFNLDNADAADGERVGMRFLEHVISMATGSYAELLELALRRFDGGN